MSSIVGAIVQRDVVNVKSGDWRDERLIGGFVRVCMLPASMLSQELRGIDVTGTLVLF